MRWHFRHGRSDAYEVLVAEGAWPEIVDMLHIEDDWEATKEEGEGFLTVRFTRRPPGPRRTL